MENIIEVKNLTKKFKDLVAVDDVSFGVKKGEIFAFLGPNGAGKSTTIKMMTTVMRPTSGEIKINGFRPETEAHQVRKSFGIVFQDSSLDDKLTAYENLKYHGILYGVPRADLKPRIEKMLKFVDLWKRRKDVVKKYSGGMKRRLEVARGLLHHPEIFFLDEPTLGLDPQTRNYIWKYIKNLNQEKNITIFFTTHYMEEVEQMADRVAIIDHGKIIISGTVKELLEQTGKETLEQAFIELTGRDIREEDASAVDQMRNQMRH
ncbi:ATP-binding cassette domain-containing protein [Patescibacteria group bacterium]|nr:ATP-binding cassette domain-containing protein [Patescibacteria group bacterium]